MLYYEEKVEYLVNHYGPICPIAYEKKGRTDISAIKTFISTNPFPFSYEGLY